MSTEQKTLGQIAWEIETECYGWQWSEETEEYRAHWERIAQAVEAAVVERQKSAPQPTADERVAEHMLLVGHAITAWSTGSVSDGEVADAAVEQSAHALLSASQEDAKQQARLVELVLHMAEAKKLRDWEDFHIDLSEAISIAQALKEPKWPSVQQ